MRLLWLLALTMPLACASAQPASIDTARSSVTVQVYKSGLFSGLAHNHTIKAPVASGTIDIAQRTVSVAFKAAEMKVTDSEGSESEHQEIEETMKGPKVLDASQFPAISFSSTKIEPVNPQQYKVTGDLKLHGVSRSVTFPVTVSGHVYKGYVQLKQTEFGITPVKIAGGAVKVKDEIQIDFEIVAH